MAGQVQNFTNSTITLTLPLLKQWINGWHQFQKIFHTEIRHLKASTLKSASNKTPYFEQSRFLVGKSSWLQMSYCWTFCFVFLEFFLIHFILNCSGEKNIVHIISANGEQTDSETRVWKYSAGVQLNTRVEALSFSLTNPSHNQQDVFQD